MFDNQVFITEILSFNGPDGFRYDEFKKFFERKKYRFNDVFKENEVEGYINVLKWAYEELNVKTCVMNYRTAYDCNTEIDLLFPFEVIINDESTKFLFHVEITQNYYENKNKKDKQLKKNNKFLTVMYNDHKIISCLYCSTNKKWYPLDDKNLKIILSVPKKVIEFENKNLVQCESNDFFLTDTQMNVYKEICDEIKKEDVKGKYIVVEGNAGTGKSYLAKRLAQNLENAKYFICSSGEDCLSKGIHNIQNYKTIIVDEFQRIYEEQLDKVIDFVSSNKNLIVFRDVHQVDFPRIKIDEKIKNFENEYGIHSKKKLKESIRINNANDVFLRKFIFNEDIPKRIVDDFTFEIIKTHHTDISRLKEEIDELEMCKFLIPSTYTHNVKPQQKHYYHVGMDIENVVVFVDEYSLFDGKEIKNSSNVWKGQNKKFAGALYIYH